MSQNPFRRQHGLVVGRQPVRMIQIVRRLSQYDIRWRRAVPGGHDKRCRRPGKREDRVRILLQSLLVKPQCLSLGVSG